MQGQGAGDRAHPIRFFFSATLPSSVPSSRAASRNGNSTVKLCSIAAEEAEPVRCAFCSAHPEGVRPGVPSVPLRLLANLELGPPAPARRHPRPHPAPFPLPLLVLLPLLLPLQLLCRLAAAADPPGTEASPSTCAGGPRWAASTPTLGSLASCGVAFAHTGAPY